MGSGWRPPAGELAIGLGFYATRGAGTGGRLKVSPEDFQVREISLYPRPTPEGAYTVLRVEARNWEQHELARRLAERWRLPPGALSWAGTKDRRAISEQLLSFRGSLAAEDPTPLPEVRVLESYRADRGVVLGHHFGNRFDVVVRETAVAGADLEGRVGGTVDELHSLRRVPNWFGPQRFGEVRPVTHLVGREVVRGDLRAAVELYLAHVMPDESPEGRLARTSYAEHHDPTRALREFPPTYRFERTLLDHLARGHDPARALRALPRELRMLFVHAYQSWLFNRYLVARWEQRLPLDRPLAGDRLLRLARDGTLPGTSPIPVSSDNLAEAEELVDRERAVVAGPLLGSETPRIEGPSGSILSSLTAAEGIDPTRFQSHATPELSSEGSWRPLTIAVPPLGWERLPDTGGSGAYRLIFSLPKGCYATGLTRELLKQGASADEDL